MPRAQHAGPAQGAPNRRGEGMRAGGKTRLASVAKRDAPGLVCKPMLFGAANEIQRVIALPVRVQSQLAHVPWHNGRGRPSAAEQWVG